MDTTATLVCMAYAVRNQWAWTTYGETWLFLAQELIILAMMQYYPSPNYFRLVSLVATVTLTTTALLSEWCVPMSLLTILNTAAIPFFIGSKVPQIIENYRNGGTGQLSAWTVGNSLFGTASRAFTTWTELGDNIVLGGYLLSTTLNLIIFSQVVYYRPAPEKMAMNGERRKHE